MGNLLTKQLETIKHPKGNPGEGVPIHHRLIGVMIREPRTI